MSELCNIPVNYKEGVYHISDFNGTDEDAILFDHDEYGNILTYSVPVEDDYREIVLYGMPKDDLRATLSAFYDGNGLLQKITAVINDADTLLYIHYADLEAAKQEIKNFAIKNADSIIEKISTCTDVVARLFVEYFNDGESMDFHAKLGTAVQKDALEKKYLDSDTIADSCGDYSSDIIAGNNDTLKIMVSCAGGGDVDFFQFAVDIMAGHIREKAVEKLHKTDDFKFLCDEYD